MFIVRNKWTGNYAVSSVIDLGLTFWLPTKKAVFSWYIGATEIFSLVGLDVIFSELSFSRQAMFFISHQKKQQCLSLYEGKSFSWGCFLISVDHFFLSLLKSDADATFSAPEKCVTERIYITSTAIEGSVTIYPFLFLWVMFQALGLDPFTQTGN